MDTLDYLLRKAADWIFRRRSPALAVFRAGISLLILSIAGSLLFNLTYQGQEQSFSLLVNTADTGGIWLQRGTFIIGSLMAIAGVVWEIVRYRHELTSNSRRRVIVIEQRGLRDTSDSPLSAAVPASVVGQRDPLTIDIRDRLNDGQVIQPEKALRRIASINHDLEQRCAEFSKADVSIIYGGMLPVPFTFLTGVLLDDESKLTVFDWDRQTERWRLLDATDDEDRFLTSEYTDLDNAKEAVVALSVSYPLNLSQIKDTFPSKPLIHMALNKITSDNHWSNDKQAALASQLLDVAKSLSAKGIEKLHLVIAAPNSVVFRLGRAYDKRNLPEAIVYQYERSHKPAYPWGVLLPTHGVDEPKVVYTNDT